MCSLVMFLCRQEGELRIKGFKRDCHNSVFDDPANRMSDKIENFMSICECDEILKRYNQFKRLLIVV